MEGVILTSQKWDQCFTSSYVFQEKYLRISKSDEMTRFQAQYFLEECLISYEMCKYSQFLQACSALYLANKFRKCNNVWGQHLIIETQYQESDLRRCAKGICLTVKTSQMGNLKAVRKKYAQPEFQSISLLPELNPNH